MIRAGGRSRERSLPRPSLPRPIWTYERGVQIPFIRPAKPFGNAYVESFKGKFRDECLNQTWFQNLDDARKMIEAWRRDYCAVPAHSSL